jgi:hypothetical protein
MSATVQVTFTENVYGVMFFSITTEGGKRVKDRELVWAKHLAKLVKDYLMRREQSENQTKKEGGDHADA